MIPAPGAAFSELDSADLTDDGLDLFVLLTLSDGTLVGISLPIEELIRRGHTIVEPTGKPALYVVPALQ